MPWLVLVVSGLFEAVWATALSKSEGFTKPLPIVVFVIGSVISVAGLGLAMKHIPVGTAYAIWTGIGGATTVAYAMITKAEPVNVIKILLIMGIIACVAGLKLVGGEH